MTLQIDLTPQERLHLTRTLCQRIELNLESPEFCEALFAQHREQITTGGVRAGKSTSGASKVEVDAQIKLMLGQPALYWIVGPDYNQTHEEFRYLKQWAMLTGDLQTISEPMDGPRVLELKGNVRIETKSAQYPERLGSVAPDGILVVEAGQCSDEIRRICIERSMEKSAWILYTGTLEDDENHPRWAWYSELAEAWENERTPAHASYRLPSWANRTIYGSCLPAIKADPSLAELCPDEAHGSGHSGPLHPEIARARENLDPYSFDRRIAAKPVGLQYQVYGLLDDPRRNFLLPFDNSTQIGAVGGIDYGTVHPTALVAVTLHPRISVAIPGEFRNVAWIREVAFNDGDPGDTSWLRRTKDRLSRDYKIYPQAWRADPNERYLARSFDAEAVSGSAGAREGRIGLVNTRLKESAILFDINGPGVRGLYDEMRKVRRVKQRSGQLELRRLEDDRTAALEDAIEGLDGIVKKELPRKGIKRSYSRQNRRREMRRV